MGRDCLIDFTAVAGSQYDLEITTALASNSWSPLVTNIPGIDGTVQLTDTNAVSHSVRFYRVKSSM
jgi:hypothetical protein